MIIETLKSVKNNSKTEEFVMCMGGLLSAEMCPERCIQKRYWTKVSAMTDVICSNGSTQQSSKPKMFIYKNCAD